MSGYSEILKFFLWSWQVYFRISYQCSAENLFNRLDKRLNPNLFLIGCLTESIGNRLPICVKTEGIPYTIEDFSHLNKIAQEIYDTDED